MGVASAPRPPFYSRSGTSPRRRSTMVCDPPLGVPPPHPICLPGKGARFTTASPVTVTRKAGSDGTRLLLRHAVSLGSRRTKSVRALGSAPSSRGAFDARISSEGFVPASRIAEPASHAHARGRRADPERLRVIESLEGNDRYEQTTGQSCMWVTSQCDEIWASFPGTKEATSPTDWFSDDSFHQPDRYCHAKRAPSAYPLRTLPRQPGMAGRRPRRPRCHSYTLNPTRRPGAGPGARIPGESDPPQWPDEALTGEVSPEERRESRAGPDRADDGGSRSLGLLRQALPAPRLRARVLPSRVLLWKSGVAPWSSPRLRTGRGCPLSYVLCM